MEIRAAYDKHGRYMIVFPERGKTQQSFKEQCDVNNIMRRFEKTGVLEGADRSPPQYGDFSNVPDYHTALNQVIEARAMFDNLPARVRRLFGNDPGELLKAVEDESRQEEMFDLGILRRPEAEAEDQTAGKEEKVAHKAPAPKGSPEPKNEPSGED